MRTGDPEEPCFTWIVMAHASACFSAVILLWFVRPLQSAQGGSSSSRLKGALLTTRGVRLSTEKVGPWPAGQWPATQGRRTAVGGFLTLSSRSRANYSWDEPHTLDTDPWRVSLSLHSALT